MVLWSRIRYLRFEYLPHQLKRRWYSQIPALSSSYYIAGTGRITMSKTATSNNFKSSFICRRPTHLHNVVRYFAAPVQVKPKPEAKDSSGPRLNNQITGNFVRLVSDEGHTVVSRCEALDRARKLKLDLVEVQRTANPPVCKIMDFHREKYKKQIQEKDRAKTKSDVTLRKGDCKEVRFSGKTEQKDLQMKADTAKRLMEKGYRVKCMAMGTEDQDLGGFISRLSALIEDIAIVESGPRVEKRQAYIIVRHVKFGPSKNGPAKRVAKVPESTMADAQKGATSSTVINTVNCIQTPKQIEESLKPTESGLELEDEVIPDQADLSIASLVKGTDGKLEKSRTNWSAFGASGDDFEEVFDVDSNGTGKTISFTNEQMDVAAGSAYPRQVLQTVTAKTPPSPVIEPKVFTEVSENYSSFSSTQQKLDINRIPAGAMNAGRVVGSQLSDQQNPHPTSRMRASPSPSPSPSVEQNQQLGNGSSPYRPLKQPPSAGVNDGTLKQVQGPLGSPTSPFPSYGIFSAPKSPINPPPRSSNKQNSATEVNSQKQKTESGQRPEADQTSERKWGIFSSTTRE